MDPVRADKIETRVDGLAEREADMRVRITELDIRVSNTDETLRRIVTELEGINRSIQPLSEWANKSKGGLATVGAIIGLLFVIVGALATQVFRRLFES